MPIEKIIPIISLVFLFPATVIAVIVLLVRRSSTRRKHSREFEELPPPPGFERTNSINPLRNLIDQFQVSTILKYSTARFSNIYHRCTSDGETWVFDFTEYGETTHATFVCFRIATARFHPIGVFSDILFPSKTCTVSGVDRRKTFQEPFLLVPRFKSTPVSVELENLIKELNNDATMTSGQVMLELSGPIMIFHRTSRTVSTADRAAFIEDAEQLRNVALATMPQDDDP